MNGSNDITDGPLATTPPSKPAPESHSAPQNFAESVAIMARLRGPGGCPWDREQNFDTIRKHTIEEAYEVLDAIERRDWAGLQDELGDLLLQVLFYSQMAEEEGHFSIAEVVAGLNRKLIRRHPHVFGDEASRAAGNATATPLEIQGIDARQVLRNWDAIKQAEKIQQSTAGVAPAAPGRLASVPRSIPALIEAAKLGFRAAKAGFDWPNQDGLFGKIVEESAELREAIDEKDRSGSDSQSAIEEELGDLLFTVVNLARHSKVDPELALRQSNSKFRARFQAMEAESVGPLEELSADQLEDLWAKAKLSTRPRGPRPDGPTAEERDVE